MNSFNYIRNEYKRFQSEFSNNINDKFGSSINNEGLEPILRHIDTLIMQENNVNLKIANINQILFEAKAILLDLGA